jgi:hypothetical protein
MPDSPSIRVLASNAVRVTHFDPSKGMPTDRPWLKDVLYELPETEQQVFLLMFLL